LHITFNEAGDDGVAVASAGVYAYHLYLNPEREPFVAQLFTGHMPFLMPTNSIKALNAIGC